MTGSRALSVFVPMRDGEKRPRPPGVSCRGGGAALIVRVDSQSRERGRAGDVQNPAAGTVQLGTVKCPLRNRIQNNGRIRYMLVT